MARKNTSKIDSIKRRKTGEKEFKEFSLLGLKKHIPRGGRYRFNIIKFNRIKVAHATERAKLTKDRIRKIFFRRL